MQLAREAGRTGRVGKGGRRSGSASTDLHAAHARNSHQGFLLRQKRRSVREFKMNRQSLTEISRRAKSPPRSRAIAGRSQRDSMPCHATLPGASATATTPLPVPAASRGPNALKKTSLPPAQPCSSGRAASGAPPPQNQKPLTADSPDLLRASLTPCWNSHISVSLINRRS